MKRLLAFTFILLHAVSAYATDFYVDPSYTGGANDGSAAHPWVSLAATGACAAMNAALASADVNIYYSARIAASDTPETTTTQFSLCRTDTSTHIANFSGNEKYNTNDTSGSWTTYSGSNRFTINRITAFTTGNRSAPYPDINYWKFHGFHLHHTAGGGKIAEIAGAHHWEFYDNEADAATGASDGPGIIVLRPLLQNDTTCLGGGGTYPSDGKIYNNNIHETVGEGIYIAGTTNNPPGCSNEITESDILIYGNTITDAGLRGAQPDGMDIKDGLVGLKIHNNILKWTQAMPGTAQAAISLASGSSGAGDGEVYSNYIEAPNFNGISTTASWTNTVGRDGFDIRNNIIVNPLHSAISMAFVNNKIRNNTIYQDGVGAAGDDCVITANTGNIVVNNAVVCSIPGSGGYTFHNFGTLTTHDYNIYRNPGNTNHAAFSGGVAYTNSAIPSFESHSISTDPAWVSTAAPYDPGNFKLASGSSPAYNTGTNTNCATTDYFGDSRPLIVICDIGAQEANFSSPSTPPVPGNSGIMSTSLVTETTLTLDWTAATDDNDPPSDLEYKVYRSLFNNISTVAAAKANGTAVNGYTANIVTLGVTGLTAGTTYYFNVLVRDSGGNEAAYAGVSQVTSPVLVSSAGQTVPFAPAQYMNLLGTGPAAGYKICTYAAGTSSPLSTYATAQDAIDGTNPIAPPRTLDSAGRIPLFFGSAAYKIILYPAAGVGNICNGVPVGTALWTYDNIRVIPAAVTATTVDATTVTTDTLNVDDIAAVNTVSTNITDTSLTSGRVVIAGASGLLRDDGDMTFATDTLTVSKIVASTSLTAATLTDSALTSTRIPIAGTAGLLGDDSDLTFATDTLTATKITTTQVNQNSADLTLKTTTSGNIYLVPATAATASVQVHSSMFQTAMGTTIVSGSCSSGDCTLPGDGNFFLLSGTTAVDGFSTAGVQAGTIFTFTTTGNLTLNDSGTVAAGFAAMKLVGGANVSMTADDLIQLIYDGSVYNQLAPVLVK